MRSTQHLCATLLAILPVIAHCETKSLENQATKTVTGTWDVSTDLHIGSSTSGNNLVITNGGQVTSTSRGNLGHAKGSDHNQVVITGSGSSWSCTMTRVGYGGNHNTLKILNGGTCRNSIYSAIGYRGSFNHAIVDGAGSLWKSQAGAVGRFGNDNFLEVTNGGKIEIYKGSLNIGSANGADRNSVTIDGTESAITATKGFYLGSSVRSDNTVNGDGGQGNALIVQNGALASTPESIFICNQSTIKIGNQSRVCAMKDYDQSSDSQLEISCSSISTNSGQLVAEGEMYVAGLLVIQVPQDFTPEENYSVQLIQTSQPINGRFDDIILPIPPKENQWDTSQLYTDGILRLTGPAVTKTNQFTNLDSTQAAKYRPFRTINNKRFRANLIDFDPSTKQAHFELTDGSRQLITITSLIKSDQTQIDEWHLVNSLLKKRKLRLSHERIETKERLFRGELSSWSPMFPNLEYNPSWHTTESGTAYRELSYHILLQNRSKQNLENIRVEYCIYHEATVSEKRSAPLKPGEKSQKKQTPPRIIPQASYGELLIKKLHINENRTVGTQPIKLFKRVSELKKTEHSSSADELISRKVTNKLLGIRYRISIPTPSGNTANMEYASPKTLIETTEWPETN